MTREWLRKWRQVEVFYCPQCRETLQLKVGEIMIPHFSHQAQANCLLAFSEGETKEHLQGKQQLYDFFVGQQKSVQLEPYLKKLVQRPDLLVELPNTSIPIEFQCSVIPIAQIRSRTLGYQKENMNPVWLLKTPHKLKKLPQGIQTFSISKFEESFFTLDPRKDKLFLTYDPQTKYFHYFSAMLHVEGRQSIGLHRILPLSKQIFPFAKPKEPTDRELKEYISLFKEMRKKYLSTRIFVNRKGVQDPFLLKCYELRLIPSELPIWIGVPIKMQDGFALHACAWQLEFVHFATREKIRFSQISYEDIKRFVQKFDGLADLQIESCVRYCAFLNSMGIVSLQETAKFDEVLLVPYLSHCLQSEMKIEKI